MINFQSFSQNIQNQFLREKDLRENIDNKLNELYKTETRIDSIYQTIDKIYSVRLSELSSKLSMFQKTHLEMEKRIKSIEIEKQQTDRSTIRIIKNDE